ncbi:nucleotidyltransferase family protein [Reichenbachiella carrageenanivorans]|uniref:Nucleotidyltransferase family protein n=1 Tax=Reichenbachiella carrageenanivorans TaxID=2979869 RepID=A0ABY6CZU6_9BACT|nr:nucleotidyltransferase family protein [Reichenbachiella carrageenanivorans]UXX78343.1 nucleotidyltransferase family protein [Reichenbachiella carrageenanivorans]
MAAGSSSRLGQPKQLLPYKGKTLLENIVDTASAVSDDVRIVLGSRHKQIAPVLAHTKAQFCYFKDWSQGMGSTLSYGIQQVLNKNRYTKAVLVLLCDQLHVTSQMLEELIFLHQQSDHLITACGYDQSYGVPALFDRKVFLDLLSLSGEQGAKKIIQKHFKNTQVISFPEAEVDIDTPKDLALLR